MSYELRIVCGCGTALWLWCREKLKKYLQCLSAGCFSPRHDASECVDSFCTLFSVSSECVCVLLWEWRSKKRESRPDGQPGAGGDEFSPQEVRHPLELSDVPLWSQNRLPEASLETVQIYQNKTKGKRPDLAKVHTVCTPVKVINYRLWNVLIIISLPLKDVCGQS